MNKSAKELCNKSYKELVTNIEDHNWAEKNLASILKFIVNITPYNKNQISAFYEHLLQQGILYAEDMLLLSNSIAEKLKELDYLERTLLWADLETYNSLDLETQNYIYGIKLFADGELYRIINKVIEINKPIAIHAVGDMATEQVINALFKIMQSNSKMPIIRIEHSQFISKSNAEKAKSLGIVLSMQPNFNYDSIQYSDRLPREYLLKNNPFRMLLMK